MPNSFADLYLVDPTARARRLFWHLLSIGTVVLEEPDQHQGLDKPGAHLFWVESGKGTLEVPELWIHSGKGILEVPKRVYSLNRGPCCWLVDMKRPRTYAPVQGKRICNTGLRFGGPELEAWREELGKEIEFTLDQADLKAVQNATQKMSLLVRRRPAGYEWEVHVLITQVLGRLMKQRGVFSSPQLEVPKPLARAINLVMADRSRHWQVPELASAAGASRSGLQRMFKLFQQESIHEFLQRMRLDQARQLLCDRRLAIKEVSARLNFSSEFYFSRFFRRNTGISPRQFRESIKV